MNQVRLEGGVMPWWALEKPWRLIDTVGSSVYLQKQEPSAKTEDSRGRDA